MLISHLNSHLKKEIFWTPTRTFKLPEVFHRRVIQLRDELSRLTGCQAMREWLIYNHPVNPTISTLLQRTNEEKSVGLTISTQWHPWIVDDLACCLVTSCVHPCAPIIQLNQPLQVNPAFLSWPLPVTVQRAGKCLLFQRWPYGQVLPRVGGTVLLQWTRPASVNSSTNKGMSPFASTCNLTGWAQPCRKAGDFPAPGSHRQIRNRFMLSALILHPNLIVDRPIKQATVGNILASRISRVLLCALLNKSSQSLIWAGQMSS